MNAILEALDREELPLIQTLLRTGNFEKLIRQKYLDPDQEEESGMQPDSQESQEAAQVDEKRMVAAAQTWTKLSDQERQKVEQATAAIYCPGEAEEIEELLNMRVS